MRNLLSKLGAVLVALLMAAGAQAQDQDLSMYKPINYKVRDLALIYQGASYRIPWNQKQLEPYVTHKFSDGREEWLFDGFLFIEFNTGGSDPGWFAPGTDYRDANKADWETYMDRLFATNKSLDALDKLIAKKKETLGDPGFRHKISLTVFIPMLDQKDWGELDGKALDFSKAADRQAAAEWFMGELIRRFNEQNYENLDLFAMYFVHEDTWEVETFIKKIAPFIHNNDLDYIWIPYFKARGSQYWKSYKFDIAYHQPNHFFRTDIPDSRLDDAIDYAKEYDLALEFECDEDALSQSKTGKISRLKAYIDYFEKRGIWYDTPIAYYTGNHMFYDMAVQPSLENNEIMDRLCQFIVNRRVYALQNNAVEQPVVETDIEPVYYNLQGLQVAHPSGGIFIEKRGDKITKVAK